MLISQLHSESFFENKINIKEVSGTISSFFYMQGAMMRQKTHEEKRKDEKKNISMAVVIRFLYNNVHRSSGRRVRRIHRKP